MNFKDIRLYTLFFRVITFPLTCLQVSLPQSGLVRPGTHRLVMDFITPTCQGTFTCQVTTAAPPFHTGQDSHFVTVSILPESPPILKGLESHYTLGSFVNLTCQSISSVPPANISWTVNGRKVKRN